MEGTPGPMSPFEYIVLLTSIVIAPRHYQDPDGFWQDAALCRYDSAHLYSVRDGSNPKAGAFPCRLCHFRLRLYSAVHRHQSQLPGLDPSPV
jgi:hypothetical protein